MTEGSQTPGGEPPRRSEGDLLAERRARRAAESGDSSLVRRAEAAEATLRTLETHVASLQQRLSEAEEERRRTTELVDRGQASPAADHGSASESELRRAKQREYAEQQLRVEAEDRYIELERVSRAEIDRLSRALSASERDTRELAGRLESVQRELDEVEQAAAAERAAVRRTERELQVRLTELERRAVDIQRGLDAETAARERSEHLLQDMREGHRRVEVVVRELRGVVTRLRVAATARPAPEQPARLAREPHRPAHERSAPGGLEPARGGEMADALAAAVERLRARVEAVAEVQAVAEVEAVGQVHAPGEAEALVDRRGARDVEPDGPEGPGEARGVREAVGADAARATASPVGSMSPSREPLLPAGGMSWWAARRAKRRARKHR
jgi:chromosome segregation ATPase